MPFWPLPIPTLLRPHLQGQALEAARTRQLPAPGGKGGNRGHADSGPIGPQAGGYPAASLLVLWKAKPGGGVEGPSPIEAAAAEARTAVQPPSRGTWTQGHPTAVGEARGPGLPASTATPHTTAPHPQGQMGCPRLRDALAPHERRTP